MLMASAVTALPVADVQHVDPELRQIARAVLQAQSKDRRAPARPQALPAFLMGLSHDLWMSRVGNRP